MKVLITGAGGLLGNYLSLRLMSLNIPFVALTKSELDITSVENIIQIIESNHPTHIINCAAYTDVTRAENQREFCYEVNVNGVINLVKFANQINAELIQISSDYVFDGTSNDGMYYEDSIKNPLNYYGYSKSIAEDYISKNCYKWKIVRTSWLFGKSEDNFVNKILSLSNKKHTIKINNIEIGSPTYGLDLAKTIIDILPMGSGVYHVSNSGFASRYEYAKFILDLTTNGPIVVDNELSKLVKRPQKVILVNNTGIELRSWKDALKEYLSKKA